jgi:hypothetical protein
MDDMPSDFSKNCTTTECGHCFHTGCLLQNVLRNGFGCPYCREQMVDEPAQLPEEYESEDELDNFSEITNEEEDYTLTSMRMLFQRAENEEVEEEEEPGQGQEEEEPGQGQEEEEPGPGQEEEEEEAPTPPHSLLVRKLQGQGITYEELVKHALLEHDEFSYNDEYDAIAENIFATIRIAISNFNNRGNPTTTLDPRFQNLFTTAFMPDYASMFTVQELKVICREYGIRYTNTRQIPDLHAGIWYRHHPTVQSI